MLKSIFAGIFTSLFIQSVIIFIDYLYVGYWITPELDNFLSTTAITVIFFSIAWYLFFKYLKSIE